MIREHPWEGVLQTHIFTPWTSSGSRWQRSPPGCSCCPLRAFCPTPLGCWDPVRHQQTSTFSVSCFRPLQPLHRQAPQGRALPSQQRCLAPQGETQGPTRGTGLPRAALPVPYTCLALEGLPAGLTLAPGIWDHDLVVSLFILFKVLEPPDSVDTANTHPQPSAHVPVYPLIAPPWLPSRLLSAETLVLPSSATCCPSHPSKSLSVCCPYSAEP